MTERIYYKDAYIKEFDARILECEPRDGHFCVVPDASAFFPEGGGQSGDRGSLILRETAEGGNEKPGGERPDGAETVTVLDTQDDGDDVILICDRPVKPGTVVHGVIDWQFRFDRMQNHSGEHIVSGLIHKRFGYNNVGFHMSADRMTIDLDGEIGENELREIEEQANSEVWQNRRVHTDVYTEDEAKDVEFRSKKELHGQIRVVTIDGSDVCACCGTHVKMTGEIGPILIVSRERFHGGVRLELMCGRWAYNYLSEIFRQNHEVSMLLNSPATGTGAAAKKLLEDDSALKAGIIEMQYERIARKSGELASCGPVLIFAENFNAVLVQKLTARVMEVTSSPVFSFSGNESDGYKYAIGQENGNLRELVKKMNFSLDGRGGGKPFFLQGSVRAGRESIESFLRQEVSGISVEDM